MIWWSWNLRSVLWLSRLKSCLCVFLCSSTFAVKVLNKDFKPWFFFNSIFHPIFFPVLANMQHSKSHATVREGRKCTHLVKTYSLCMYLFWVVMRNRQSVFTKQLICRLIKCTLPVKWPIDYSCCLFWFFTISTHAMQTLLSLRCFDIFCQRPYLYFSIALKVILSLSDRYKIFTNDWL